MGAQAIPTTATVTLIDLPNSQYHLKRAVVAEIEPDDAGFVVSEQRTGVFYYDTDWAQALSGFLRAFVDEFEFLKRNEDHLSPSLQADLENFRALIREPETETALSA